MATKLNDFILRKGRLYKCIAPYGKFKVGAIYECKTDNKISDGIYNYCPYSPEKYFSLAFGEGDIVVEDKIVFKVGDVVRHKGYKDIIWHVTSINEDGFAELKCGLEKAFVYLDDNWEALERRNNTIIKMI